ncbi:MAG: argininosuccinate lyase [Bacteroidetes bacterium]|uniref:Argininosuccinate lyase n=1 Tax=Candidatus Cryptobacteroides merdigallinarum TaxID=2840770 RepID=A0A9D9EJY5_9BACT|nr:argininosuccinate lyase [Candidatus Cryptobacteroides merdigallinarum]
MATLWNKGTKASDIVEDFTVGNDRTLDMALAKYDVKGSKAHIRMLESIGLLTREELDALTASLDAILEDIDAGKFVLEDDVEDIHSQVELLLTRRLGDMGKKIHSGRSRNDQVLVDIKLFLRDELLRTRDEVLELFGLLQELSEKYREVLLPGYTHGQVAMPSSFGLWFGGYAEALADDMYMLKGAYHLVNQNPLGSAAGYGNSFPLDREMTTRLLEFEDLDYNVVAAQLSRGKAERAVASAIGSVALTLNKFASDCCLYMCPNFGFISFPDELTTGSSIMPHKKNPDVWEIIRGNCNRILGCENEISLLCSNMPHGYHRDFQLLKDILFPALELMHRCIRMTVFMLREIRVNTGILDSPIYDYLFTVEEVNRRTLSGTPFRDAYRSVGIEVNEGRFHAEKSVHHTHAGSIGNLCNEKIAAKMKKASGFRQ